MSILAVLNGVALLIATFAPPLPLPNVRVAAFSAPARSVAPALPTRAVALPRVAPTPTAAPVTAQVSTEGNVRAAPSKQSTVVGFIRVREQVTLRGRSADGAWLQLDTAQGVRGWAHRSLLRVDEATIAPLMVLPSTFAAQSQRELLISAASGTLMAGGSRWLDDASWSNNVWVRRLLLLVGDEGHVVASPTTPHHARCRPSTRRCASGPGRTSDSLIAPIKRLCR